jgi:phospholipase C
MRGLLLALVALSAISAHAAAPFKRVFIVILENENNEEALEQPFLARLAREGAYLADYHGVTHPSYPNYLALTSGSTWNAWTDFQKTIDGTHIGDLLEAKGLRWKTYAEGYPGGERRRDYAQNECFLKRGSGKYARKHVPFLSYKNIQDDLRRCDLVVNADQLERDVKEGHLPDYALYIPDLDNDGHDTSVRHADQWLARTFGPLLKDPRFAEGTLFVVTFDEDDDRHDNHIYTALWGDAVRPGARVDARFDHYNLLRTIEDAFGLGTLGRHDAKATAITGIWRTGNGVH